MTNSSGAGSGNRTRIASLEGWNSTIELHLHVACQSFIGAGSGNRTRIASLEGWNSTIELHLHCPLTSINYNVFDLFCQEIF